MSIFSKIPTYAADHTVNGQTWSEWADELFEFEFCENCGGDTEDHLPMLALGHWVAVCKLYEEDE